jgi:hypothetical protein
VDLKVPIVVCDELMERVVRASAMLNLASGEITDVAYLKYDTASNGFPWARDDYEFSSGMLSNNGKDIEFTVQVNTSTGQHSVNATELLEIKTRAAALFSGKKVT